MATTRSIFQYNLLGAAMLMVMLTGGGEEEKAVGRVLEELARKAGRKVLHIS